MSLQFVWCVALVILLIKLDNIHSQKLTLGVEHTHGRWTFSGSGWTDFKGDWGANVGVKFRFRKRSSEVHSMKDGKFYLFIEVDRCEFDVYDENSDGVITAEELYALFFPDKELAEKLLYALDSKEGDATISIEEFKTNASKFIEGCQDNTTYQ